MALKRKLFLSYGRKDGEDLASRLKADLERVGFEVWQDTREIRAGAAWDEQIRASLVGSDAVLSLLTPHAVRAASTSADSLDSVCLDEINYFRFQLKRPIIPVMAITCEPPLAIYRLEYVDMRDWRDKMLYDAAFQKLLEGVEAALRGEIRNRSWISDLIPWDFSPFLNEKRRNFFGREWMFDEMENWLRSREEHALLIKGDAGSGKSAIVAELVHDTAQGRVLAYHCCQADILSTLQPGQFVRSIAAMIASRLEDYAAALSDSTLMQALSPDFCSKDPAGALEIAVLAPIHQIAPPQNAPRILVIDALDEALAIGQGASPLTIVDVLAMRIERLPDWLRVVATTRKDPAVLDRLRGLRSWEIDAQDPRNLNDLRGYIRKRLRAPSLAARAGMSGQSVEDCETAVFKHCEGNFLYAQQVLDGIEREAYSFRTMGSLPPGLYGLYTAFFNRYYANEESYASLRPILEIMTAAREPLTGPQIAAAASMDLDDELPRALRHLNAYLRRINDGYTVFHKSLSDWLTAPDLRGTLHYVNRRRGHERLADLCWGEYQDSTVAMSLFALQHLPSHLAGANLWSKLQEILSDLRFIEQKCAAALVHGLIDDLFSAGQSLSAAGHAEGARQLEEVTQFVTSKAHLLAEHPNLTFQEAANMPRCSAVATRARSEWESGAQRRPWLDWVNREDAPGRCVMTFIGNTARITSLAVSASGDFAASGAEDGSVRVWRLRTGAELFVLRGHDQTVTACAFSPNERRLVSGSEDGRVRIWDAQTGELLSTARSHKAGVIACAFDALGISVRSVASDGHFVVSDSQTGARLKSRRARKKSHIVYLSHNGNWLAESALNRVRVTKADSGKLAWEKEESYSVWNCAFSPDSTRIAISSVSDRRAVLTIRETNTGAPLGTVHGFAVTACAFSSDNRFLLAAYGSNELAMWDLSEAPMESESAWRLLRRSLR